MLQKRHLRIIYNNNQSTLDSRVEVGDNIASAVLVQ